MPKDTNKKQNTKKQEVKKDTKKQDSKNKKHFMKDFKAELKRVIWPTPKQLLNNTVAVITVVLITAAIVFVLDFVFESMNTYGINKLKEVVETTNTVDTNSLVSLDDSANVTTDNEEATNDTENNESEASNETENNVSEDSNSVEE